MVNKRKTFKTRTQVYVQDKGFFIVDNDQWDLVKTKQWHFLKRRPVPCHSYTDPVSKKRRPLLLSRLLMNAAPEQHIDHINGNPKDNRVANLRFASPQQNAWNRKTKTNNVFWHKTQKRFKVIITANGKKHHLGSFKSREEALKLAIEMKNKFYGEFSPHRR